MSQLISISRSGDERRGHYGTTALLLVIVAPLLFAADWMTKPSPDDEKIDGKTGVHVDWSAPIEAIQRELAQEKSAEVTVLHRQLDSVREESEDETFSVSSKSVIENSLAAIHQNVMEYRARGSLPSVDIAEFVAELEADTRSLQQAEREATEKAIQDAEGAIRTQKSQEIRDVRLEVRDQQDQAAELRHRIAKLQREQSEFQAKNARAQALQAEMPDVRRYLRPFTTPGHLQPRDQAWSSEWLADVKPVSLARLKKLGALEPTKEGYDRLYIFGGGKNPTLHNKRPLGGFPLYVADHRQHPEILAAVIRAQELLRDHGQALVEAQLLSP